MTPKNKKLIAIIALTIIITLGAISFFVARNKLLYHYAVVEPGKVYRSGTLSDLGHSWALAKSKFKTIINLRSKQENKEEWHNKEKEFADKHGIELIDIAMKPDTPPSAEQIKQFLKIANDKSKLPLIIHCHQGITRTAMMVAVYEIAIAGKPNQVVYKNLKLFGHSFDKPDKKKIKAFILNFKKPTKVK